MDKIDDLLEEIKEGVNNLQGRTNFNLLKYKNLLPIITASLSNYQKSNNLSYIKGLIDQFHQTAIATTEGADTYNNNIWDVSIEVRGEQTTLDELFCKLNDLYLKLYRNC